MAEEMQHIPTTPKAVGIAGVVLIVLAIASFFLFGYTRDLQKEAAGLDARVDWKAVATGQKPIYIVEYRVVKIEHSDIPAIERTIEELGLQVDIWNDEGERRDFLFGGATDTAIRKLQEQGYKVTVLYSSFEEYQKDMEGK